MYVAIMALCGEAAATLVESGLRVVESSCWTASEKQISFEISGQQRTSSNRKDCLCL